MLPLYYLNRTILEPVLSKSFGANEETRQVIQRLIEAGFDLASLDPFGAYYELKEVKKLYESGKPGEEVPLKSNPVVD